MSDSYVKFPADSKNVRCHALNLAIRAQIVIFDVDGRIYTKRDLLHGFSVLVLLAITSKIHDFWTKKHDRRVKKMRSC